MDKLKATFIVAQIEEDIAVLSPFITDSLTIFTTNNLTQEMEDSYNPYEKTVVLYVSESEKVECAYLGLMHFLNRFDYTVEFVVNGNFVNNLKKRYELG